jgi:hypothetical protein
MTLNNWLQGRYGTTNHLTWDAVQIGPTDSDHWEVIAYGMYFSPNLILD